MKCLFSAFFLCVGLVGCVTPSQKDLETADYGAYPTDYEDIIKSYMKGVLRDPESARYEFLNNPKKGWNGIGGLRFGYVVCVRVNGKNAYGGYVGYRMSYFMINNGRVIDASHGDGAYGDSMVQGKCSHFI